MAGPATSTEYLPLQVAQVEGYFTQEKLEVTLKVEQSESDAALALAMLHVVIAEDLVDRAFVAQHTVGLERLAAHVAHGSVRVGRVPRDGRVARRVPVAQGVRGLAEDRDVDLERDLGRPASFAPLADVRRPDVGPFRVGLVILDHLDDVVDGCLDQDRSLGVFHQRNATGGPR